jgi:serine/threonine protein kinase
MRYKEYELTTHQSVLTFKKDTVEKNYLVKHEKNRLSSVANEMYCLSKFATGNSYAPEIIKARQRSYVMKRYDFSLGNTKRMSEDNVRRLLFTIPLKEVLRQLNEIQSILNHKQITHRDINPGNLLFCEKEKKLKLNDFYFATTDDVNTHYIHGVNGIYKKDDEAFDKIRKQLTEINQKIIPEIKSSKKILSQMGQKYYDGSAKHKGKTYHPIDIPYYGDGQYHKDINFEFRNIIQNINYPIESVIDIGCAAGFYAFNLIRMYKIQKYIGYEADPVMLSFLQKVKKIFRLEEIAFNDGVFIEAEFPSVDMVICMNVHMWLEKQFGQGVDKIMANLIKNSKVMFFQTSHAESAGMYKVMSLKNQGDIEDYLKGLGASKVELIGMSKRGGKRFLFKVGEF